MTQEFLLDAVVEDLRGLFKDYHLENSMGVRRTVNIFPQDVPIREGDDDGTNPEDPPEPYVVVRLQSGSLLGQDQRQTVKVILVICVHDPALNRQGYRDALHIVNRIITHYGKGGIVARRYEVQYPIEWTTQEEDTHPYYFTAVAFDMDAPAIFKEVPET